MCESTHVNPLLIQNKFLHTHPWACLQTHLQRPNSMNTIDSSDIKTTKLTMSGSENATHVTEPNAVAQTDTARPQDLSLAVCMSAPHHVHRENGSQRGFVSG